MTLLLPDHLRIAGVAWVVTEAAATERDDVSPAAIEARRHRTHTYALHWAVMRGLDVGSDAAYEAAVSDAKVYRLEHAQDVEDFLAERERQRK